MTSQVIKDAAHSAPFRPFTLHLADGRNLTVRHPEYILVTPNGRTAVVTDVDNRIHIVDVMLVTSLESAA